MKKFKNNKSSGINLTDEMLIEYITSVKWTFAKTMPKWPHWYTIRDWNMDKEQTFVDFVYHIRKYGVKEPFYKKTHIYFYFHNYKYWTMGDPLETTWVINRALKNAPIYK